MSVLLMIVVMSASVYALRISGLMLQDLRIPAFFERALRFAPIALISALAASSLASQTPGEPLRLVAALGAGVMVLYTHRIWVGIFGGLAIYWLLRLVAG